MILGRTAILALMKEGSIGIEPFQEAHLKAASYSLTIGRLLNHTGNTEVAPGEFLLAETREHIRLDAHIAAFISTRGSAAQLGLDVIQSSTFVEPGTNNPLVLEIHNCSQATVPLTDGAPIAKLVFMRVETEV